VDYPLTGSGSALWVADPALLRVVRFSRGPDPKPTVTIARSNNGIELELRLPPGPTFILEASPTMAADSWQRFETLETQTAPFLTFTRQFSATAPKYFYRLREANYTVP
jgi:hypothetical protein